MWLLRLRQTAVKSLGQLTAPDATGPITDLITPSHGNGDPVRERTTDYKLDTWFCQTSLEALERILNASPSSINETDLERIATLPDVDVESYIPTDTEAHTQANIGRVVV